MFVYKPCVCQKKSTEGARSPGTWGLELQWLSAGSQRPKNQTKTKNEKQKPSLK